MSLIVKANDVFVEYKGRTVLDIPSLEIYEYDRIGLIGLNGSGKTTLLRILSGEVLPEEGSVDVYASVSFLQQFDGVPVDSGVSSAAELSRLGVAQVDCENASGGELTRIKMAHTFSGDTQAIFADEPTSHLDSEGIDVLTAKLNAFQGALLIVSHNRAFLDNTINKIWELDAGKITEYWGNYTDYREQKRAEEEKQARLYREYREEKARLEAIIHEKKAEANRLANKAHAKKNASKSGGRLAHQKSQGSKEKSLHQAAKSVEKKLESLIEVEPPVSSRRVYFRQNKALELHNKFPIVGEDVSVTVGDKLLISNFNFEIALGSKIALLGRNGGGKTTLLKCIRDACCGITLAPKAKIGYFSQIKQSIKSDETVLGFIQKRSDYSVTEIRSALASVGMGSVDVGKKVSVLSGGQTVKLQLLTVLLGCYNILLLDEPDNYLDTSSIEALERMIGDYQGTIIFVTHDRSLIEGAADGIIELHT